MAGKNSLNIDVASVTELIEAIKGVGKPLAEKIVKLREPGKGITLEKLVATTSKSSDFWLNLVSKGVIQPIPTAAEEYDILVKKMLEMQKVIESLQKSQQHELSSSSQSHDSLTGQSQTQLHNNEGAQPGHEGSGQGDWFSGMLNHYPKSGVYSTRKDNSKQIC